MAKNTDDYIVSRFGIGEAAVGFCNGCESVLERQFAAAVGIAELNQYKVLAAMGKNRLSESHFAKTTGYGYNDIGRDVLERIYADVFNAELALVRPQIISGTHALTVAMAGNLRYGDVLLSVTGPPYDTLQSVIGIKQARGSLAENGIAYKQVDLIDGKPDFAGIETALADKPKMAIIQRSKGYSWRRSLSVCEIGRIIEFIKNIDNKVICLVDNCYGEFVEVSEPSEVGADLTVGSLIKNPGGGLAPVGGYIAGRAEFVENAACRLSSPGIGREAGPGLGITGAMLQGLFMAPEVVGASVRNAVYTAEVFKRLGFAVLPEPDEERADIVQAVRMGTPENVAAFCNGIQKAAPVDGHLTCEPWDMPGYGCPVIMAAGTFVSGSSIELSADAPMRAPYIVYFQGGLTRWHGKIGVMSAVDELCRKGRINLSG